MMERPYQIIYWGGCYDQYDQKLWRSPIKKFSQRFSTHQFRLISDGEGSIMHDIFIASLNFWPLLPPGVKAQTALSTRFKLNFPNIFFATRIYANIETLYAICFRDKMLRQNSTWRVITHCPDEEVEITWFISYDFLIINQCFFVWYRKYIYLWNSDFKLSVPLILFVHMHALYACNVGRYTALHCICLNFKLNITIVWSVCHHHITLITSWLVQNALSACGLWKYEWLYFIILDSNLDSNYLRLWLDNFWTWNSVKDLDSYSYLNV